jgi:hypothetical protein
VDIEKDTRKNEHALYKMKTLQIRLNSHIEALRNFPKDGGSYF